MISSITTHGLAYVTECSELFGVVSGAVAWHLARLPTSCVHCLKPSGAHRDALYAQVIIGRQQRTQWGTSATIRRPLPAAGHRIV